jgi:signal transduction histidine kinase
VLAAVWALCSHGAHALDAHALDARALDVRALDVQGQGAQGPSAREQGADAQGAQDDFLSSSTAEYLASYHLTSPPPPAEPARMVRLPVHIQGHGAGPGACAVWLRQSIPIKTETSGATSVYVPYASPSVAAYLNGTFVGASAHFGNPRASVWNYPQIFPLSAGLLRPGGNQLLLEILGSCRGVSELAPVMVGSTAVLSSLYQRALWRQVIGVEVVSLLVGLIGLFFGLLWWRRRSDVMFGLFSLTCALWIVRNTQFFMDYTLVPAFYFSLITNGVLFWLVAVLYTLCFRILGRSFPRIEAALFGFALAVTLALLLGGARHTDQVLSVAYILIILPSAVYMLYLLAMLRQDSGVLLRLLLLAAVVSSSTGAYDLALMQEWIPWPGAYLMPYSALFYALTVGWALIDRFVQTNSQYERLNAELEARVHARERELADNYERAAHLESARAIAEERGRILRDMHDGLGMHLISSMRLVEKGDITREQTVELLTEAMDELRIAIDSVKPTARDLLVVLGNLRYRLEVRLRSAGIELQWDIGPAAPLERLTPAQVAEITRIVQEAFTNAMKHSHASHMSLSVSGNADDTVQICVTDNGCGFVAGADDHGEGLKNMRQRANRLGGKLQIESHPGETTVRLTI